MGNPCWWAGKGFHRTTLGLKLCSSCAPGVPDFTEIRFVQSSVPTCCSPRWCSCVCLFLCVHTWLRFCLLGIFSIFKTPHITSSKEAKSLTLNWRKGSLLPLYFVQKCIFNNTSGVKMLWAGFLHLWNAWFWNYQNILGDGNWGFLPSHVTRMFWQMPP